MISFLCLFEVFSVEFSYVHDVNVPYSVRLWSKCVKYNIFVQ